jgi:hypothetical protein
VKNIIDLESMVTGHKQVTFVRCCDGDLWYVTEDGFEFPVPVADIGNATFLARDKALLFMRWMRKHREVVMQAANG